MGSQGSLQPGSWVSSLSGCLGSGHTALRSLWQQTLPWQQPQPGHLALGATLESWEQDACLPILMAASSQQAASQSPGSTKHKGFHGVTWGSPTAVLRVVLLQEYDGVCVCP